MRDTHNMDDQEHAPKAMVDALTSISKNVKFKRNIKFSFQVLLDMLERGNISAIMRYSWQMESIKGYKEVLRVLHTHPSDEPLVFEGSKILLTLTTYSEDEKFADKLAELNGSNYLLSCIETEPEKDNQTKMVILDILKFLLRSSGVLHKVVVGDGYKLLLNLLGTVKPSNHELDSKILEVMALISKDLDHPDKDDIKKVLEIVKRNQGQKDRVTMCRDAATFLHNEYSKVQADNEEFCGLVNMEDMISAFGEQSMDLEVYSDLSQVVKKIFNPDDVSKAVENIKAGKDLNTNFSILAHLADTPQVQELIDSGNFTEIEDIITKMMESDQFAENFMGTMGLLNNIGKNNPGIVGGMISKNPNFLRRIIETMEKIKPNERHLGFSIIKSQMAKNADVLLGLDFLSKLKAWIGKADSIDEMVMYEDCLIECAKHNPLRLRSIELNIMRTVLAKVQEKFPMNCEIYENMLRFMHSALQTDNELTDFIKEGGLEDIVILAIELSEVLEDDSVLIPFILKMFEFEKSKAEAMKSFDMLMKIFSGLIERRCTANIRTWYSKKACQEIWTHAYLPPRLNFEFLRPKEKEIVDTLFKDFSIDDLVQSSRVELGQITCIDRVNTLDLHCATTNCYLNSSNVCELYDQANLFSIVKNLSGGIVRNKDHIGIRHDKTKLLRRSHAMMTCLSKTLLDPGFFKTVYFDSKNYIFPEISEWFSILYSKDPLYAFAFVTNSRLFNLPIGNFPLLTKFRLRPSRKPRIRGILQQDFFGDRPLRDPSHLS